MAATAVTFTAVMAMAALVEPVENCVRQFIALVFDIFDAFDMMRVIAAFVGEHFIKGLACVVNISGHLLKERKVLLFFW